MSSNCVQYSCLSCSSSSLWCISAVVPVVAYFTLSLIPTVDCTIVPQFYPVRSMFVCVFVSVFFFVFVFFFCLLFFVFFF